MTDTIELTEKDYKVITESREDEALALRPTGPASRAKPLAKKKPITIFNSLTFSLNQISEDKSKIFLYLEIFLNNRPSTKENLSLAIACKVFADLNDHEKGHTSYEDLVSLVKRSTSGRHEIDPSAFYGAVAGGAHMLNISAARDIAAVSAPEVVGAMVRRATNPEGGSHADSKLLLEVSGVVSKDGPNVVINNQLNSQTNVTVEGDSLIPKFMGKVLDKDSILREHYRKSLKQPGEAEL